MAHLTGVLFAIVLLADGVLLLALVVIGSATGDLLRYLPGQADEGSLGAAVLLTVVGAIAVEAPLRGLWRMLAGKPPEPGPASIVLALVLAIVLAIGGLVLAEALPPALAALSRRGGPTLTLDLTLAVGIVAAWVLSIPIRPLVLRRVRETTTRCVVEPGAVTLELPLVVARGLFSRWPRRSVRVPFAELEEVRIDTDRSDPTVRDLLGVSLLGTLRMAIFRTPLDYIVDAVRPRIRIEGDPDKPTKLLWATLYGPFLILRGPRLVYAVTADPTNAGAVVAAFAAHRRAGPPAATEKAPPREAPPLDTAPGAARSWTVLAATLGVFAIVPASLFLANASAIGGARLASVSTSESDAASAAVAWAIGLSALAVAAWRRRARGQGPLELGILAGIGVVGALVATRLDPLVPYSTVLLPALLVARAVECLQVGGCL